MATQQDPLFGTPVVRAAFPRFIQEDDGVTVKTLASSAGAELLPVGTPLAFNDSTGFWVPYVQGGANGTGNIRGFVFPEPAQLSASAEVQATVFTHGVAHRDDINTATIRGFLGGAPSEANLDAALAASLVRELGLKIQGLPGVK